MKSFFKSKLAPPSAGLIYHRDISGGAEIDPGKPSDCPQPGRITEDAYIAAAAFIVISRNRLIGVIQIVS